MKAKYKKSIILASSALSLMVGAAIVLSSNENLFSIMMRARGVTQNYSVTFDTNCSYTYESVGDGYYNNTITARNSSGITFTMTVSDSYGYTDSGYIAGVDQNTIITFSQPYEVSSKRTFQTISSFSITSSSAGDRTIDLFFNGSMSPDDAMTVTRQTTTTYNVLSEYEGTARSLVIAGQMGTVAPTAYLKIKSLTINFTCNPDYDEGKTLTGITLDTSSAKTAYEIGDTFDSSDVVVTAHYDDLTTADVSTSATFSGYNMSIRGNQTVTVSYTEVDVTRTATYTISIHQDVDHIGISGQITAFLDGGEFSLGGGVVTAYYNAGETDYDDVTELATFSPFAIGDELELSDDGTTITVSFDGETTSYSISVTSALDSITISGQTTTFNLGDTFAFGGTVTAHYEDSTSANVTSSATFTGYDLNTLGDQTVTVSYTEVGITRTTTYQITVQQGTVDVTGSYTFDTLATTKYYRTLQLNANGVGTYVYRTINSSGNVNQYTVNISYTVTGSSIRFDFVSFGRWLYKASIDDAQWTDKGEAAKGKFTNGNALLFRYSGGTGGWTAGSYNDTGSIVTTSTPYTITLKIYNAYNDTAGTDRTFTKQ